MESTRTEEINPSHRCAHLLMHDILEDLPIDLERLRAMSRAVDLNFLLSIFALRVPVPYEFRLRRGRERGRRRRMRRCIQLLFHPGGGRIG